MSLETGRLRLRRSLALETGGRPFLKKGSFPRTPFPKNFDRSAVNGEGFQNIIKTAENLHFQQSFYL